jgi:predicted DNA-binding protein
MESKRPDKTTFRMGDEYHKRLAEMARKTGLSQTQLVRIGLDKLAMEMGLRPISQYVPNLEASFPMMN